MQRRDFIKDCGSVCLAGLGLGLLTASCGSVHYATSTIDSNTLKISGTEFIDEKKKERKFILVKTEKLPFPICIYKKGKDYVAVYMQCSHQGCELHANDASLVCPCHGSEFSTEGKVLSAPADKDLRRFKVTNDNETIYVEI